jgi:hypothetical protein
VPRRGASRLDAALALLGLGVLGARGLRRARRGG